MHAAADERALTVDACTDVLEGLCTEGMRETAAVTDEAPTEEKDAIEAKEIVLLATGAKEEGGTGGGKAMACARDEVMGDGSDEGIPLPAVDALPTEADDGANEAEADEGG